MAFISVKFQRITAYICFITCLILIYHLYYIGSYTTRSKKEAQRLTEGRSPRFGVKREAEDHGMQMKESSHDELGSATIAFKTREDGLHRQIETLESQLISSGKRNDRLREKILSLENKMHSLRRELLELTAQKAHLSAQVSKCQNKSLKHHLRILEKETAKKNPLEIPEDIPFQSFAKTHVFEVPTDPKPKVYIFHGQRKETRTIKPIRKHLLQVQEVILRKLHENISLEITSEDLFDGVYRFDINNGVDYEVYFKNPKLANSIIPVRLTQKLETPNIEVLSGTRRHLKELINLILPLSGRLERFQNFIDLFINVCVKKDQNVFLTVVLYGEKDFKTVKTILQNLENDFDFRQYQLIMRDKVFSRGRALHDGVVYWKGKNPNVLMFFCDVDITFRPEFLRRCRAFTEPGKQVYYPVVFSLYNPKNVYEGRDIPEPEHQLKIDNQYGFWRSYGFGMTCQYRSDYMRVGGFDLSIEGWGSEDQLLHSRYIEHRGIRVIRAPDRDLFHYYHEKYCDPNLKWQQYRSCLGSKAKTEGTPAQVAMQLMKLREKYDREFDDKNN